MWSQSGSATRSIGAMMLMPALLTRMSIVPKGRCASTASRSTAARSARSAATQAPFAGVPSRIVARPVFGARPDPSHDDHDVRRWPRPALRAKACPWPLLPPVTRAVAPRQVESIACHRHRRAPLLLRSLLGRGEERTGSRTRTTTHRAAAAQVRDFDREGPPPFDAGETRSVSFDRQGAVRLPSGSPPHDDSMQRPGPRTLPGKVADPRVHASG